MGIYIYADWGRIKNADIKGQVYLHETHHSGPNALQVLAPEAFKQRQAEIDAATLQDRLPAALIIAETVQRQEYDANPEQIDRVLQRYRNFVALCARKEVETGSPCFFTASW
jgi:hypothetical protein